MYLFDKSVHEYCEKYQITYTRYADDLTFSTNKKEILFTIPKIINDISHHYFKGRLRINKLKTKFSSKAHNRHVTGVTITNDKKISIGRDKKRYIKSLVYRYKSKQLSIQEISLLKGLLAFANDIEPLFITTLENKYSVDVIASIFKVNHETLIQPIYLRLRPRRFRRNRISRSCYSYRASLPSNRDHLRNLYQRLTRKRNRNPKPRAYSHD